MTTEFIPGKLYKAVGTFGQGGGGSFGDPWIHVQKDDILLFVENRCDRRLMAWALTYIFLQGDKIVRFEDSRWPDIHAYFDRAL